MCTINRQIGVLKTTLLWLFGHVHWSRNTMHEQWPLNIMKMETTWPNRVTVQSPKSHDAVVFMWHKTPKNAVNVIKWCETNRANGWVLLFIDSLHNQFCWVCTCAVTIWPGKMAYIMRCKIIKKCFLREIRVAEHTMVCGGHSLVLSTDMSGRRTIYTICLKSENV